MIKIVLRWLCRFVHPKSLNRNSNLSLHADRFAVCELVIEAVEKVIFYFFFVENLTICKIGANLDT